MDLPQYVKHFSVHVYDFLTDKEGLRNYKLVQFYFKIPYMFLSLFLFVAV